MNGRFPMTSRERAVYYAIPVLVALAAVLLLLHLHVRHGHREFFGLGAVIVAQVVAKQVIVARHRRAARSSGLDTTS